MLHACSLAALCIDDGISSACIKASPTNPVLTDGTAHINVLHVTVSGTFCQSDLHTDSITGQASKQMTLNEALAQCSWSPI